MRIQSRAREAARALQALSPSPEDADNVATLVWAAGTSRDIKDGEGLVTTDDSVRALRRLKSEPSLRAFVQARERGERAVLLKGVGAGLSAVELEKLAGLIAGKPLDWLIKQTCMYGIAGDVGLRQSFTHSCGPAVAVATEAEINPLLAVAMDNQPEREHAIMSAYGGKSYWRGDTSGQGVGTALCLYVDQAGLAAGVQYTSKSAFTAADLDDLAKRVRRGWDAPVRIANVDQSEGHFASIVDCVYAARTRLWRVYDPWTGDTTWFNDKTLFGELTPGRVLTHIFVPHGPGREGLRALPAPQTKDTKFPNK